MQAMRKPPRSLATGVRVIEKAISTNGDPVIGLYLFMTAGLQVALCVRAGLVKRRRSQTDRRKYELSVTGSLPAPAER
jgi:hypothetical protein